MEPMHVLLVEDNAGDRSFVCGLLGGPRGGTRVSCAPTVTEGLEAMRSDRFDCALLDYSLPDGNALDILEALGRQARPVPPAVILTGRGSERIAAAAFKLGAADYLRKEGLTAESLRQALEEAIRARRSGPGAAPRGLLVPGEAETLLSEVMRATSDEIQPPIRFLNGLVRELHARLGDVGGEVGALLETTRAQVLKANRLVHDLLRFERQRRYEELISAVDPVDAIALACFGNDDELGAPGALEIGELPLVEIAPHQLVDLFRELLDNSVRFRGTAPLRVRIDGERSGNNVVITVDDAGPGIPAELSERVFGLFERGDPSSEGSGLGLALARRIAHVYGGLIWCEPSSVGCRIRVSLPAANGPTVH